MGYESSGAVANYDGVSRDTSAHLLETEPEVLRAIRNELRSSYPLIKPWKISRIARKAGLLRFPLGLMIPGSTSAGGDGERALMRLLLSALRRRPLTIHALFDPTYYRIANPDLAGSRVPEWLHYQVFGRAEGRSPHPLLSVSTLADHMPGVPVVEVIDEYLGDSQWWSCAPSPYVDTEQFVARGPWDGRTHPFLQIVEQHMNQPWVRTDLLQIDSSSTDSTDNRSGLAAAVVLMDIGARRYGVSTPATRWPVGRVPSSAEPGLYRVVPGSFIARDGTAEAFTGAPRGRSLDGTAFLLATEAVMRKPTETITVERLVMLQPQISRDRLVSVLHSSSGSVAIGVSSRSQESVLDLILQEPGMPSGTVLPWGRQTAVSCREFVALESESTTDLPIYESRDDGSPPSTTALVLMATDRDRLQTDSRMRELLERGVRLCLVVDDDLRPWHHVLTSSRRVIVERALAGTVSLLIDPPEGGLWLIS
ncbi:MAG: hypothetical protein KF680_05860 [Cryobacterium sp.]|nr:hypothetical protein [Cryobacterium sp.]